MTFINKWMNYLRTLNDNPCGGVQLPLTYNMSCNRLKQLTFKQLNNEYRKVCVGLFRRIKNK